MPAVNLLPNTCEVVLGAGTLADEPGYVWKQRSCLSPKSVNTLEAAPFLCIEDGKLKVDLDVVESIDERTDAGKLVRLFKEALVKKNVPSKRKYDASNQTSTSSVKDVIRTLPGGIRVRDSDIDGPFAIRLAKRANTMTSPTNDSCNNEIACESTPLVAQSENEPCSPYHRMSQRVDVLCVPYGMCSCDKLSMFDMHKKMKVPDKYSIALPMNSYDGMNLDFACPPVEIRLLMLDGSGYKVGGTYLKQHAVRLHVHRAHCTNKSCNVMGCSGDVEYKIFEDKALPEDLQEYKAHWTVSRRGALRARGAELRFMSGN